MKILRTTLATVLAVLVLAASAPRGAAQVPATRGVFQSTGAANLPTATTNRKNNLLFEISHRFDSPVSDGADALWGFDGPVFYRLGLSWGLTDRLTVGVIRSNLEDNLELNGKARLWERDGSLSLAVGVKGGIAWNTQPFAGAEDDESQGYAQLLLDAGLGSRVAVGAVPTWIRNPRIQDPEAENGVALGLHGLVYVGDDTSLFAEWIVTEEREGLEHDSGSFGLQLETRGHFFKVLVTNQVRANATQFLGGAPVPVAMGTMRVAFNITRRIPF